MQVETIDPKKTAMIVVDMQNDFVAAGAAMETPAARAMAPRLAEALRICRAAQIKVIYTAHVHGQDGCTYTAFRGAQDDDMPARFLHQRSLRVTMVSTASMMPTIQKRVTILDSW